MLYLTYRFIKTSYEHTGKLAECLINIEAIYQKQGVITGSQEVVSRQIVDRYIKRARQMERIIHSMMLQPIDKDKVLDEVIERLPMEDAESPCGMGVNNSSQRLQ